MDCNDRVEHGRIKWTIESNPGFLADAPLHRARPMLHALDLDCHEVPCAEHAAFQREPAASCRKIEYPGIDRALRGAPQPDSRVQFNAWAGTTRWSVALTRPPIRRHICRIEEWQPCTLRNAVRRFRRFYFIMFQFWSPPTG